MIALIISNPICSEIGERYWFDFDAIGSDGDHVYIFVRAAPRHSPSKAMQIVKSIPAREFFQEIPLSKETALGRRILELRRLHRNSRWCVMADIIRNYVEKQGTSEDRKTISRWVCWNSSNYRRREHAQSLAAGCAVWFLHKFIPKSFVSFLRILLRIAYKATFLGEANVRGHAIELIRIIWHTAIGELVPVFESMIDTAPNTSI